MLSKINGSPASWGEMFIKAIRICVWGEQFSEICHLYESDEIYCRQNVNNGERLYCAGKGKQVPPTFAGLLSPLSLGLYFHSAIRLDVWPAKSS